MRQWSVAGGLIEDERGLLLVANRRKNGAVDWTPPGGVIDDGETVLGALTREVHEETGVAVAAWSVHCWTVTVDFVDLEMRMTAEVHAAAGWSGELTVADPDGIVIDVRFVAAADLEQQLADTPQWVREPLLEWSVEPWATRRTFAYRAIGGRPGPLHVERMGDR